MSNLRILQRWLFSCLLCHTIGLQAQQTSKSPPIDSFTVSHIRSFKMVGITDTAKAIVKVTVKEIDGKKEAIQGATVLLRRDKDKTLGRVTKMDGSCNFMPVPETYAIRAQLTGYKNLEAAGLVFEKGKEYELELSMVRN